MSTTSTSSSTGALDASWIGCGGVRFTADKLTEIEHGRVMVYVARADVRRIALRYGYLSHHPMLQFIFGILVSAFGLVGGALFLLMLKSGGRPGHIMAMLVVPLFIGAYLLFDAFKRGYFLHVETASGRKTLNFYNKPTLEQLKTFVAAVRERFDYRIEDEVSEIPARL